jgi:hypothetical protein
LRLLQLLQLDDFAGFGAWRTRWTVNHDYEL